MMARRPIYYDDSFEQPAEPFECDASAILPRRNFSPSVLSGTEDYSDEDDDEGSYLSSDEDNDHHHDSNENQDRSRQDPEHNDEEDDDEQQHREQENQQEQQQQHQKQQQQQQRQLLQMQQQQHRLDNVDEEEGLHARYLEVEQDWYPEHEEDAAYTHQHQHQQPHHLHQQGVPPYSYEEDQLEMQARLSTIAELSELPSMSVAHQRIHSRPIDQAPRRDLALEDLYVEGQEEMEREEEIHKHLIANLKPTDILGPLHETHDFHLSSLTGKGREWEEQRDQQQDEQHGEEEEDRSLIRQEGESDLSDSALALKREYEALFGSRGAIDSERSGSDVTGLMGYQHHDDEEEEEEGEDGSLEDDIFHEEDDEEEEQFYAMLDLNGGAMGNMILGNNIPRKPRVLAPPPGSRLPVPGSALKQKVPLALQSTIVSRIAAPTPRPVSSALDAPPAESPTQSRTPAPIVPAISGLRPPQVSARHTSPSRPVQQIQPPKNVTSKPLKATGSILDGLWKEQEYDSHPEESPGAIFAAKVAKELMREKQEGVIAAKSAPVATATSALRPPSMLKPPSRIPPKFNVTPNRPSMTPVVPIQGPATVAHVFNQRALASPSPSRVSTLPTTRISSASANNTRASSIPPPRVPAVRARSPPSPPRVTVRSMTPLSPPRKENRVSTPVRTEARAVSSPPPSKIAPRSIVSPSPAKMQTFERRPDDLERRSSYERKLRLQQELLAIEAEEARDAEDALESRRSAETARAMDVQRAEAARAIERQRAEEAAERRREEEDTRRRIEAATQQAREERERTEEARRLAMPKKLSVHVQTEESALVRERKTSSRRSSDSLSTGPISPRSAGGLGSKRSSLLGGQDRIVPTLEESCKQLAKIRQDIVELRQELHQDQSASVTSSPVMARSTRQVSPPVQQPSTSGRSHDRKDVRTSMDDKAGSSNAANGVRKPMFGRADSYEESSPPSSPERNVSPHRRPLFGNILGRLSQAASRPLMSSKRVSISGDRHHSGSSGQSVEFYEDDVPSSYISKYNGASSRPQQQMGSNQHVHRFKQAQDGSLIMEEDDYHHPLRPNYQQQQRRDIQPRSPSVKSTEVSRNECPAQIRPKELRFSSDVAGVVNSSVTLFNRSRRSMQFEVLRPAGVTVTPSFGMIQPGREQRLSIQLAEMRGPGRVVIELDSEWLLPFGISFD